jgi:alkanesulfonate monooxygenase SsuD/methylene tetrahydromethanopterin reductase-like flavin-dependent oxidoreductase (luciferase family)
VDVIAGGRLILGIGAGGSAVAMEQNPAVREFAAYGVPLVPPGQAVRDLGQSLDIITRMWTEDEPFDFTGPTITLTGAVCEPKPVQRPHPPVMIGGQGERLLRVVAGHADIWTYPGPPDGTFRQRDQVLREHCAAIGRDPAEIIRSMQIIVRCDQPGAVPAARGQLLDQIGAGVRHLVIAALLGDRPVQWLADEIVYPVLAGTSQPLPAS